MKKIVLALLAACGIASANAQSESSVLVFGNVGFHSMTDEAKSNTMSWNVSPGVGYAFNKNWTVGVLGGYSIDSSYKISGGSRLSQSTYTIGVFGRYTQHIGDIFCIFGQLEGGYMSTSLHSDGESIKVGNGFYGLLAPYVGVNVCHGFALNFQFGGLKYNSFKPDGASNSVSNIDLTFGQQLSVGISKNFGCGHKAHTHREPMEDTRKMDTSDDSNDEDAPKKKKKKSDDE